MYRFLTIVCLLLLPLFGITQEVEHTYSNSFFQRITHLSPWDGGFALGGESRNGGLVFPFVAKIDTLGNLQFLYDLKPLLIPEVGEIAELREDPDGNLIVVGRAGVCDVGMKGFIISIAPDGSLQWVIDEFDAPGFNGINLAIDFFSDNDLLIVGDGQTKRLTQSGDILWNKDHNLLQHGGMVLQNDTVAVIDAEGIRLIDPIGEELDQVVAIENLKFIQPFSGGGYLAAGTDGLRLFNEDWESIDSACLGMDIWELQQVDSTIWVLGGPAGQYFEQWLFPLSSSLEPAGDTIVWKDADRVYTDFWSNPQRHWVIGWNNRFGIEELWPSPPFAGHWTGFLRSYDWAGANLTTGVDAGVEDVQLAGELEVTPMAQCLNRLSVVVPSVSVAVKNYGTDTLTSVEVLGRFSFSCPTICGGNQVFRQAFLGLSIPPDSTQKLDLGTIEFISVIPGQSFSTCFWTNVPNGYLDNEQENDLACSEIVVSSTNPLHEKKALFSAAWSLEGEFLQIKGPSSPLLNARIIGLQGQVVEQRDFHWNEEITRWYLEQLPAGYYILHLQHAAGQQSLPFTVVRP
jgi:hypothetical protein